MSFAQPRSLWLDMHILETERLLLREFVADRLSDYPEARNHPEQDGTSRFSPYLHFGHLSPHTVAFAVQRSDAPARWIPALRSASRA